MPKPHEVRTAETPMYVQEAFRPCYCPDCPTSGHWGPSYGVYWTTKEEAEQAAIEDNKRIPKEHEADFPTISLSYGEPCETCGGCCDECTEETDCDVCIANRPGEKS